MNVKTNIYMLLNWWQVTVFVLSLLLNKHTVPTVHVVACWSFCIFYDHDTVRKLPYYEQKGLLPAQCSARCYSWSHKYPNSGILMWNVLPCACRSGNEEKLMTLLTPLNVNCHASDGRKVGDLRLLSLALQAGLSTHWSNVIQVLKCHADQANSPAVSQTHMPPTPSTFLFYQMQWTVVYIMYSSCLHWWIISSW